MANRVLIKRGLSTNLSNAGVVDGELKYATDENELYIGDGKKNIKIGGSGGGGYSAIYHKFLRLIEGDTPFNEVLVNFYSTDSSYIHLQGTDIRDVNLKQWIANNIFNGETNVQLGVPFQVLRRGSNADPQYPIITDSKIYWYNNQMTFSYIYWVIENGALTRKSSSITLQNSGTYNTWGHGYVQTIGKIV